MKRDYNYNLYSVYFETADGNAHTYIVENNTDRLAVYSALKEYVEENDEEEVHEIIDESIEVKRLD